MAVYKICNVSPQGRQASKGEEKLLFYPNVVGKL
jgi:hypothetical protein